MPAMKSLPLMILCLFTSLTLHAQEHLNAQKSPIMKPAWGALSADQKSTWLPSTFGGVTGVVLDLDKVGTNEMLRVQFVGRGEMTPLMGEPFELILDKTEVDEKRKATVRTVVLVSDKWLKLHGYKEVFCYKVTYQEKLVSEKGTPLVGESTSYVLEYSQIKDQYDVLHHQTFRAYMSGKADVLTK